MGRETKKENVKLLFSCIRRGLTHHSLASTRPWQNDAIAHDARSSRPVRAVGPEGGCFVLGDAQLLVQVRVIWLDVARPVRIVVVGGAGGRVGAVAAESAPVGKNRRNTFIENS